ncbi:hypothetical protein LINPERPRIM_LOCUS3147 [Linum perenne]
MLLVFVDIYIWSIILCSGSLWVAWMKHYKLKKNSLWEYSSLPSSSWVWKKMMTSRKSFFPHLSRSYEKKLDVR